MHNLKVTRLVDNTYVSQNILQHNKLDFGNQNAVYLKIKNTVYLSTHADNLVIGNIGLNTFVRNHLKLAFQDPVSISVHDPIKQIIKTVDIRIVLHGDKKIIHNLHEDQIKEEFIKNFNEKYYIYAGQCLYQEMGTVKLVIYITNHVAGYIDQTTNINITSDDTSLNIIGSKLLKRDLFRDDYNFEEIGIGGLDKELVSVLRRCLSTRAYKPSTIEKLGIKHVKGMLLYGPPGTGKTLIARKIGSMITNKEPKVVNGPEIMNKFVGESEKNIRELFADAISDTTNSELHVIIFDEIDAICKTRGRNNSGTGVNDSIVNQLLTMIEGYKALNNIFIIAMTNRKDLLDEALLRAGRIEVHIEIGLPDKKGREQIFRIHTGQMKINNMLAPNIHIEELAELTENYSGAEIEAVVRNAGARALHDDLLYQVQMEEKEKDIVVQKHHFISAIDEVVPSFGNVAKQAVSLIPNNYNHLTDSHKECYDQSIKIVQQDKKLNTILIVGDCRVGKTVLAIKIAVDSKIKNTKIIRAIDLVSFDEVSKVYYIADIVKNSYVSEESLIVLDDIEIAINYAQMGNNLTFSNRLYQVLITLLKTEPTNNNHKITFICTCTDPSFANTIKKLFDLVSNLE